MNLLISGISEKDGRKIAYVSFRDGSRLAEAIVPDCKVVRNQGFDEDEVNQLERYLQENLEMIRTEAAGINPIKAMMREKT